MIIKTVINKVLKDVTAFVGSISWCGSNDEVARTLTFQWLYSINDKAIPRIDIQLGQMFYFYTDSGKEVFRGRVFDTERRNVQGTIQITCYDDAIRLSMSKGTFNFKKLAAETMTQRVAAEIGIKCGNLAPTKIPQKMLCQEDGLYEIIKEAYKGASKQNGKSYKIIMMQGKLNVIEIGKDVLKYVLDSSKNIIESSFSASAEDIINRVKIYDENGKYISTVNNTQSSQVFGVFQEIYKKEKDKQALTVAKTMLKASEKTIQVKVLGNISLISGYTVKVRDDDAKITGEFVITSDNHEWSNGQYTTSLNLTYKGGAVVG